MESITTSLNSVFGCLDLTSVSEDLKLRELLIVLLLPTTGFSLMQGSFCCAGLPLFRDDNEEQDDEAEDALDDSVERVLFSVTLLLLLNDFSCAINSNRVKISLFEEPKI